MSYTRFELVRTLRNKRLLFFSLGFPLVLFLLIGGGNRSVSDLADSGISAPLYYMVSMTAFGTMMAMVSCGARIAGERAVGWNRQLRITPLRSRTYLATKVVTGYAMAVLTMLVLYVAGAALGVSIAGGRWIGMSALLLVGLVPFAALGVFVGHLLTTDAVGPAMGGGVSLLAFLGGVWFPLGDHGVLYEVGREMPSFWLVQAAHVGVGGDGWSIHGWAVMTAWAVVLGLAAAWAYRRDTGRG